MELQRRKMPTPDMTDPFGAMTLRRYKRFFDPFLVVSKGKRPGKRRPSWC